MNITFQDDEWVRGDVSRYEKCNEISRYSSVPARASALAKTGWTAPLSQPWSGCATSTPARAGMPASESSRDVCGSDPGADPAPQGLRPRNPCRTGALQGVFADLILNASGTRHKILSSVGAGRCLAFSFTGVSALHAPATRASRTS